MQQKVHSLAVDTETHRVYAPEEEEGGKPAARMVVYAPVHPARRTVSLRQCHVARCLAIITLWTTIITVVAAEAVQ